jgi:DNA-binding NtrC family response regulator
VVDADPASLNLLRHALESAGSSILVAPSGEIALRIVGRTVPEIALLDVGLPGIDGYELCRRLKAAEQLSVISEREAAKWGLTAFVGRSPAFQELVQDIRRAQSFGPLTVLITGECGTGKELIARAIHYGGPQAKGPFVPVNCSAIPGELAESALFGHVRGAFTGATEPRKGCFERANGGTLFLDEIGDMAVPLQAKLLRVLEDSVIVPVGGAEPRKVAVRVLAATNAELESAIEAGRFRKDLYFRLTRFTLDAPPLSDRREDIPLLAEHFANGFASEMGMAKVSLTAGAVTARMQYDYPGNVRELRNLMERALIESGGGDIRPEHLQFPLVLVGAAAKALEPVDASSAQGSGSGAAEHPQPGTPASTGTVSSRDREQDAILDHVRQNGSINNVECRELLGVGMHRAWHLLRKLHRSGRLKQDNTKRWAQYRLPDTGPANSTP